jgi:hypothetical protein
VHNTSHFVSKMVRALLARMALLQAASMELLANSKCISLTGIRTGKESERCMSKLETSTLNNAHAAEPRDQCDCPANNQDFREFTAGNIFICCTQRTVADNLGYYTDGFDDLMIDDLINSVDKSESFLTTRFTTWMLLNIHEKLILQEQIGIVENGKNSQNELLE